ncbi:alpha/beta hydrolase family protein [Actinoplanes sp. CA-030573]|uniref:alpha/beta hydrolase family protein n=1 Tax=Actinoplanes sp. CA-030573 TaxID=3239898 RepID=UPI003D8D91CF
MRTIRGAAVAVVLALVAGGCGSGGSGGSPGPTPPPPAPAATTPPPAPSYATYPVGLRVLHLHRGRSRPLPTLVFYPAVGRPLAPAAYRGDGSKLPRWVVKEGEPRGIGGRTWTARPPASGRFPLVLFSHGLSGSAERYVDALATWAAAGFVVAAPTFPYTSEFTGRHRFRRSDIRNQPADVRYVLGRMRRLTRTPGDPLWRRIDTDRMAAVGHSAGGYTTTGLFTAGHDPRLRAGVIMAGWAAPGAFAGPPATMLFLQGKADPIVPVARSVALWSRVPWPKSYVLMRRDSHATYLRPGDIGYRLMNNLVVDFLRWTLDGDEAADRRLPPTVYPR